MQSRLTYLTSDLVPAVSEAETNPVIGLLVGAMVVSALLYLKPRLTEMK
jgi:hypothetical protein